ncbi:hypothetical protein FGIG_00380 [Fasciola gigantica]|uniref:Uncharacterized protein n=1 Tax=Fasciola gigantica TaxID=46835 RepID=A0A504Z2G7_FASGI|nr:hypothetical protein FGIG_00380 [Fasciola gigantica]
MDLHRGRRPFTLEDFLIMSSAVNVNGDITLSHSFASDHKFAPSRPYPPSHLHQKLPVLTERQQQQQHLYAIQARVPNPPITSWYGGSQPSLDSQTFLSNVNNAESGLMGLHPSADLPSSRLSAASNAQFHSSSRLANQRARLRRSNTIGSSEIGQHLSTAMAKASLAPYHGQIGTTAHPEIGYEPIRFLLGQTANQHSFGSGPTQLNSGALALGYSPTERVLRRLAQMNNTSSLDRNGLAPNTGTQSFPFDWPKNARIQAALYPGKNVDTDVNEAVKGR